MLLTLTLLGVVGSQHKQGCEIGPGPAACQSAAASHSQAVPAGLPLPWPLPLLPLQGSQAYAKALAKAGVLTAEEAATIVEGLSKCVHAHNPWPAQISCQPI